MNTVEIKDTLMKGYEEHDVTLEIECDDDYNPLKVTDGVFIGTQAPGSASRQLSAEELEDINKRLQSDQAYRESVKDQILGKVEDDGVFNEGE